jgi:hypothetical protein
MWARGDATILEIWTETRQIAVFYEKVRTLVQSQQPEGGT